ncbi:MAG: hypothetical protein ACOX8B_04630 [Lachnospiraceae bacterium]|jgi:hypothetical protein
MRINVKKLLAVIALSLIFSIGTYRYNAYANIQSQAIPTKAFDLVSSGDYKSTAYTNGYRLYTNYYFYCNLNRCHFYGTSYNASSSYYLGVIEYFNGYTNLYKRGSGTTIYNLWLDSIEGYSFIRFYCGFNMTANSSSASNAFGVGTY